jgi:hypothetical protein
MMMQAKSYQYYNNTLCIPASLLYDDWGLLSYKSYLMKCYRGQLIRVREGKGKGNEALLSYHDLPQEYKMACKKNLGDYKEVALLNQLEPYIIPDVKAIDFFATHRYPDGRKLDDKIKIERATNCCILNAVKTLLTDPKQSTKAFGPKKSKIWDNISDAVNKLNEGKDEKKWFYNLPTSPSRLRSRYNRYLKEGYSSFVHAGEGNVNTIKIKGEIADYILAVYSLPNKFSVPELLDMYRMEMDNNGWPSLSEGAIKMFLDKPENVRIWTLSRDGKDIYDKKFKHTVSKDKTRWFPNVYWAIDGTKLDLTYYDPESSTKMSAYKRIDVVFDVHSEKIIGWSISETESHVDHFTAIKMAVQTAGYRPYLLTYDQQSGHKSAKMQELYSRVIADDGGTHYPHRAYGHGNPADKLHGMLQTEVTTKLWNSDGQGIRTKKDSSHRNMEYLQQIKDSLPTKDAAIKQWEAIVRTWNEGKHSTLLVERNKLYQEEMPVSEEIQMEDIMKYIWIEEKKRPVTYRAHGLELTIDKKDYLFEVYDDEGNIDIEFRRKNVGAKFIVRYDPGSLDTFIQLLQTNQAGEKFLVAYAEPKRKFDPVPATMRDGEKVIWQKDFDVRDKEYERDLKAVAALQRRTGITPERMAADQELHIKMHGRVKKSISMDVDRKKSLLTEI